MERVSGGDLLPAPNAPIGSMPQDHSRIWTDARGKTLTGSLTKIEIVVELKLADGRTVRVPIERLSAADQQAVRERIGRLPLGNGAAKHAAPTPAVRQVAPWTRDRSSDELRRDAIGQGKESLVQWLGAPDSITDTGEEKHLIYKNIAVDPDSHKSVSAGILIQKGRVTAVVFH